MKKHQFIPLLIPITALASCAPATPVVALTPTVPLHNHVHKHTPEKVVKSNKAVSKSSMTKVNDITPATIPLIPTHGIPGQPC